VVHPGLLDVLGVSDIRVLKVRHSYLFFFIALPRSPEGQKVKGLKRARRARRATVPTGVRGKG